MEPRLVQQQSQRLILSPQIRQYLRLLQLPIADLEQAVEQEMMENPILEEKILESVDSPAALKPDRRLDQDTREVKPGESFDSLSRMEDNSLDGYQYPDFSKSNRADMQELHQYQESLLTKPQALYDYLLWQCQFLDLTEAQKEIAQEIVGNIGEDGFLTETMEGICKAAKKTETEVLPVLSKIQELDPTGIGARNLQESLIIQLNKKISETTETEKSLQDLKLALKIVSEYLPLLEKREWSILAKTLSLPPDQIKSAAEKIAKLDPKPGLAFFNGESMAVIPDASIVPDDDHEGQYLVVIHDEKIPDVHISPYYRKMLRGKNLDEKTRQFIKDKIQSATNFLQGIQLRKSTLRGITEEIVKIQPDFLEKGYLHLKPLRLKDIANNLGIHESTVSRAIQGKYVSTSQGTIPYKSFFSTRMESTEGQAESQKSIMEKIRFMVEKESPEKPYSDEQLVQTLKGEGLVIARRTVAKYRDLLKILPSHMRRKK